MGLIDGPHCPNCEKPNQFNELCHNCEQQRQLDIQWEKQENEYMRKHDPRAAEALGLYTAVQHQQ